jgi:hypothetical protein
MKLDPIALQAERRILCIRQQRVMLDYDLAALYRVETRALKQAVRRNFARFPSDFMFELADNKVAVMVSQNVIPGLGKLGGARTMASTEQGVAMLIYVKEDAVPYRARRKASSKSIPPWSHFYFLLSAFQERPPSSSFPFLPRRRAAQAGRLAPSLVASARSSGRLT